MIFNSYSKLKKNLLYKKFKNIYIIKYKYIKKLNNLLKSKNSNNYVYNKFIYIFNNIKLLYIISNKYNLILIKYIYTWYSLINYKFYNNYFYIIIIIFTYF
nr:hypothetical protein [Haemoproteus lanii]